MNESLVWLSASLACLLSLSLLTTTACLFLIRRVNRRSRSEDMNEQRLIQLARELRGLDQRVRELEGRRREPDAAPSLISVPDMAARRAEGEPDDAASLAHKHEDIWMMAESGLSAAEIARASGRPIGQVELIVGLHRQLLSTKRAGDHAKAT